MLVKLSNIKRDCTDCAACKNDERVAVMTRVGLVPLVPYPGTDRPWRCRHEACGNEVTPYFSNVRQGLSSGCIYCSGLAPTDPDTAAAEARRAGYQPLDTYPGLTKSKWRCHCERCHGEGWVRLEKIRSGEGCCMRCGIEASAAGRRANAQQSADLMRAAGLHLLAAGTVQTADFATGAAARALEQAVLRNIRNNLGLHHYLTAAQMARHGGGWTETFKAGVLPPATLWRIVRDERDHLQL